MPKTGGPKCAAKMMDIVKGARRKNYADACPSRDVNFTTEFHSNDFEWETLRAEIEASNAEECEIVKDGSPKADQMPGPQGCSSASSAWEIFHKNHSKALFFKERRYLVKEFPELLSAAPSTRILEAGCGTGSSVVPILRGNKHVSIYGCDCSATALERAAELVNNQACQLKPDILSFYPFLCDICSEALPSWLCCSSCRGTLKLSNLEQLNAVQSVTKAIEPDTAESGEVCCLGGVSIVTLIFTLSAMPLEKMRRALTELVSVLGHDGLLLFRDYGLYDMTMLRFPTTQRVGDRLYRRMDGTLSYFFTLEVVRELFTEVGLVEEELQYCCVELVNRRKQIPMKRVWVHAKFRKP